MKTKKVIDQAIAIAKQSMPYVLLAGAVTLLSIGMAHGAGTDYLSGSKGAVTSTFGEGSTFEKYLYVAEAGGCAIAWIKSKSPYALIGLPILMIATHFFFAAAMT